MAQGAFNKRFPHAKLFLFLAVAIALPLTVFSANKVSTSTEQHAAGYTCGPNNTNPSCPTGFSCSYTGGNPTFGGTCAIASLTKPTGLKVTGSCTSYTRNGKPSALSTTDYTLSWNAVAHRSYYGVHVISSSGSYFNFKPTATSVKLAVSFVPGNTFNWQVIAYNSSGSVQSPLASSTIVPKCRIIGN